MLGLDHKQIFNCKAPSIASWRYATYVFFDSHMLHVWNIYIPKFAINLSHMEYLGFWDQRFRRFDHLKTWSQAQEGGEYIEASPPNTGWPLGDEGVKPYMVMMGIYSLIAH